MIIEISSCRRMKPKLFSLYSGLRTRAMVCFAPMRFAMKQLSMLHSSDPVAAMNSSARSTPASTSVSQLVPLPHTYMLS